jgi:hypothetical protein
MTVTREIHLETISVTLAATGGRPQPRIYNAGLTASALTRFAASILYGQNLRRLG